MENRDFEKEYFQVSKPKMKENRQKYKQNFRNTDPQDVLNDNWDDRDDDYYDSFEKFGR